MRYRPLPPRQFFNRIVDTVLPPQSLMNGERLIGNIGPAHWPRIHFLDEPCCYACGFPFEFNVGEKTLCGDCSAEHPPFERARAAFIYDENSRQIVLSFKHGGRTDGLKLFANQLARAGRSFWPEADRLIPVPLHPSRLRRRKYNQSALLAKTLAKQVDIRFDPDSLFRIRATESQGHQTRLGRERNVQGAFSISSKANLKDAHIVLVDDVMTTGATVKACARTLKRAGVAHIDVLTLARTVPERQAETSYG